MDVRIGQVEKAQERLFGFSRFRAGAGSGGPPGRDGSGPSCFQEQDGDGGGFFQKLAAFHGCHSLLRRDESQSGRSLARLPL